MSRIGKTPVPVPSGVSVKVTGREVSVSGPKGSSSWAFPPTARVAYDDAARCFNISRTDESKESRAKHGLTRSLIYNMVRGVSEGFEKRLLVYGTGYSCRLQGRTLHINVGFSGRRRGIGAQFEIPVPDGVEVVVERDAARGDTDPASLIVRGVDKQKVGQFASEIRALRKGEPYKGKGIRYHDEVVRRKQGKALAGGG